MLTFSRQWRHLWLLCALMTGACAAPGGEANAASSAEASLAGGLSGERGAGQVERLAVTSPLPITSDGLLDTSGGPVRIIEVPSVGHQADIVVTPKGWLALSVDFGGRTLEGARSALYRAEDGVHWDQVPLQATGTLLLSDLAYGAGRYVMVGRHDGAPVLWTSSDGDRFTETTQPFDSATSYKDVMYLGDRFIAFGFRNLGWSLDGKHWSGGSTGLVQLFGAAFGAGRFVLTGSGPVLVSTDGEIFAEHEPDCGLPDVCVTDPSQVMHPVLVSPLVYAEGAFHLGRLRSADGETWSVAGPIAADGYVDEQFMSSGATLFRRALRRGRTDLPGGAELPACPLVATRGSRSRTPAPGLYSRLQHRQRLPHLDRHRPLRGTGSTAVPVGRVSAAGVPGTVGWVGVGGSNAA